MRTNINLSLRAGEFRSGGAGKGRDNNQGSFVTRPSGLRFGFSHEKISLSLCFFTISSVLNSKKILGICPRKAAGGNLFVLPGF